jgi:hypothetical protein
VPEDADLAPLGWIRLPLIQIRAIRMYTSQAPPARFKQVEALGLAGVRRMRSWATGSRAGDSQVGTPLSAS